MTRDTALGLPTAFGVTLIVFGAASVLTAAWLGLNINDLILFAPSITQRDLASFLLQFTTAASATLLVLFFPGLFALALFNSIGERLAAKRGFHPAGVNELVLASFLLSVLSAIAIIIAMRTLHVSWEVDRLTVVLAAIGVGVLALAPPIQNALSAWRLPQINREELVPLVGITVLIATLLFLFQEYISVHNFSDDEQEAAEFALSLRSHAFPYWDLENGGSWGFYHNFMLFSYPMYVLTVAFGESEFAIRALYFVAIFVAFAGIAALFRLVVGRLPNLLELLVLLIGVSLATAVAAFYNTWHPRITGLAEPSAVDMFAFALFVSSAYFLFTGRHFLFMACAVAHYVSLPNGFVYTVTLLGLCAIFDKENRFRIVRTAIVYVAIIAAYFLLYKLNYPARHKFSTLRMQDRYFDRFSTLADSLHFLRIILVLSGGGLALACAMLWKGQSVAGRVLAWFCILQIGAGTVFYELQHIHYHLPLLLLLHMLGLCALAQFAPHVQRAGGLAFGALLAGATVFMFPHTIPVFDSARRLGAATQVECADKDLRTLYRDLEPFNNVISWKSHGIVLQSWIYYSLHETTKSEPKIIVADRSLDPRQGFRDIGGGKTCKVLVSDTLDSDDYSLCYTYQSEPAWKLIEVPKWREHFSLRQVPELKCDPGTGPRRAGL